MNHVTLTSKEGKSFGAYVVEAASQNAPGIVLVQEIFGVNAAMRAAAERWASLGYHVICPDLFWRKEAGVELDPTKPEEFARGVELMLSIDEDLVVADLEVARAWLEDKGGSDRIAGLGYCWGGRLVVRMAADTGVKCAVSYYGVGLEQLVPITPALAAPTLLHIAALDSYVPEPVRNTIQAGVKHRDEWETHIYEGCDHAFARPGSQRRNEQAAQLAEQRSLAFMQQYLQ
ncbi:MAG: dienelactone hydrolase family protein [Burkholderiaceae bacterium]|nr:dienelactone hydrolase family protein [Burkholderiaceae bacterium]